MGQMGRYVERVAEDIQWLRAHAGDLGVAMPETVDSIYMGGGTPSLLPPEELKKLFFTIRQEFKVLPKAEITVECAPGTLADPVIQTLVTRGVNRVSLGVQSFAERELAQTGRRHRAATRGLRSAGHGRVSVAEIDLDRPWLTRFID